MSLRELSWMGEGQAIANGAAPAKEPVGTESDFTAYAKARRRRGAR